MSKAYELTSILDIYEKVPADRIQECCRELGLLLAQTKMLAGIAMPTDFTLEFPIEWTDDGLGEVATTIKCLDGELLTLETKLPQEISHD